MPINDKSNYAKHEGIEEEWCASNWKTLFSTEKELLILFFV